MDVKCFVVALGILFAIYLVMRIQRPKQGTDIYSFGSECQTRCHRRCPELTDECQISDVDAM
jgi:hypothetical protein